MLIFVRRDSDMCVCPMAQTNNTEKNSMKNWIVKENQKFYVKVFFGLGRFFYPVVLL